MQALLMAGGEGRRLRPLTDRIPKPLLPVKNRPILEHLLLQLRGYGVEDVTIAVAHLAPMIEAHFGSGAGLGMRISYLHETVPLGTAGALSNLREFDEPILMMNGDVLTDLDFSSLITEHYTQGAVLTVASKVMYTDLSLGVIEVDDSGRVTGYREKPRLAHRFGLGVYVVDPAVRKCMPWNKRIDMPELICKLIDSGLPVASYEHSGSWIDIGTPSDYTQVEEHLRIAASATGYDYVR